jgi:hypothetical protein
MGEKATNEGKPPTVSVPGLGRAKPVKPVERRRTGGAVRKIVTRKGSRKR